MTKSIFRLLGVMILFQVSACGSNSDSITMAKKTAQEFAIPQAIAAVLQGSDNLSAYIVIDNGARQQMTISGSTASTILLNISTGADVVLNTSYL